MKKQKSYTQTPIQHFQRKPKKKTPPNKESTPNSDKRNSQPWRKSSIHFIDFLKDSRPAHSRAQGSIKLATLLAAESTHIYTMRQLASVFYAAKYHHYFINKINI